MSANGFRVKENELAGTKYRFERIICNDYPDNPAILANYIDGNPELRITAQSGPILAPNTAPDNAEPKPIYNEDRRKKPENMRAAFQWAKNNHKSCSFIGTWLWIFCVSGAHELPKYGARWSGRRKAWYIPEGSTK